VHLGSTVMSSVSAMALVMLLILTGVVSGCSGEAPEPRPLSVLFISVDTLRSDRLGAYGYAKANTPAIDQFASEGALFENVYCDVPWTTASMTSVMTGLFSTEHGLQAPWLKLPDSQVTAAEIFRDHGYQTAAVIGIFSLDAAYGLNQGFDTYDDDFSLPAIVHPDQPADKHIDLEVTEDLQAYALLAEAKVYNDAYKRDADVTDSALSWLEENKSEPFFLWAHYFGPHERLMFGKDLADNRIRIIADYDRELTDADTAIGRLLEGLDDLGLRENTLVILSSDHGQTLGERGAIGHGRDLLEPEVRIPLIVRYPSQVEAGLRIPDVVRSVDLLPTFLDYAGIAEDDLPQRFAGRSVRALIDGEETAERLAYMDLHVVMPTLMDDDEGEHFFGAVHFQALRKGKWKLVKGDLLAPCTKGGGEVEWTMLGLDPKGREGAIQLPDDECAENGFTSLFDVSQSGPRLARESSDVTSKHPEIVEALSEILEDLAANKGQADHFDLSPDQERRLKSLGYLQDE
jgi:arylsulfatase A-like enzyme